MNCEKCKAPLIPYDADLYPNEEIEQYDPEGFRGNYECPSCHCVYGCTKSSLTLIVESIYASQFADTMTITEKNHLWSQKIRSRDQLVIAAMNGDQIAIVSLVKRTESAEAKTERVQSAVTRMNNFLRKVEEAEAAGKDTVYWRGEDHNIVLMRAFLDLVFWDKEVK